MTTYQVQIGDREYIVEIDDLGASPLVVKVNGKTFEVNLAEQARTAQTAPRSEAEAELEEAYVPPVTPTFIDAPTGIDSQPSEAPTAPGASEGVGAILAPMPGTVMDIAVRVGDQVSHGDVLCNLEAMKMKSPIRATGGGVVSQILIGEGQNVNYGDVLFTIE